MTLEEAGKAVNSFVSALRTQPLSLALVVMNIALLVLVFYTAKDINENRRFMAEAILKQQKDTQTLLSKCIDADELTRVLRPLVK